MNKLKMYEEWWDKGAGRAACKQPIKTIKRMPKMPGVRAARLKWSAFKWIFGKDKRFRTIRHFLRHPIRYGLRFLRSVSKERAYVAREGDFYCYSVESVDAFRKKLQEPDTLFALGFSYCHKPFECPSKRFSPDCIHDPDHPVCRQCFIGKALNLAPKATPIIIPTVHDIGRRLFELAHEHPDKQLLFLITACELTLEMFGDYCNMLDAKGLGVRLDGRICNTLKAFALSEEGTKPGLTVVLPETQNKILEILSVYETGDL